MSDEEYFKLSNNAMDNKEDYSMQNYCNLMIDM
ncbi:MAG: hypothetical protein ACJAZ2_001044 [Glaciecola sp.]|jgi:hypothetical protein